MANKVLMPQLGESVTEGTVSKWLVRVGDTIEKYAPICEVATDKVNAEVPSTLAGTVTEIVVAEGQTVSVGTVICMIAAEGVDAGGGQAQSQTHGQAGQQVKEQGGAVAGAGATVELSAVPANAGAKQRYSPAVLKLAQEHGLDLTLIKGTGAGGRVTRLDVLDLVEAGGQTAVAAVAQAERGAVAGAGASYAASIAATVAASVAPEAAKPVAAPPLQANGEDVVLPVTSVRKTIANRMVQSKHDAPHAWMMIEVDVTEIVAHRNKIKDDFKKQEGFSLTYLPFFMHAIVEALKEFPIMNSQWAGDSIIMKKAINVSIAVATDDALYVPVIRDADQKNVLGLAKAVDQLARKTREGKLTMDDMSGGTFTINNTGSFGSVLSAPIINQPQAAIVSLEAIVKRPVVLEGNMIAIRDMMNICLSLDHRVLDGLVCGRFLQSVKSKLEGFQA